MSAAGMDGEKICTFGPKLGIEVCSNFGLAAYALATHVTANTAAKTRTVAPIRPFASMQGFTSLPFTTYGEIMTFTLTIVSTRTQFDNSKGRTIWTFVRFTRAISLQSKGSRGRIACTQRDRK